MNLVIRHLAFAPTYAPLAFCGRQTGPRALDDELPLHLVGKGLFKPGATGLDDAEFVGENAFATRFLERVELQRQILVFARHSGVANQHALNFSLSHQVLDTHLKHDETRTTIQEWFSKIARPHFWLLCYRGFHVLVKEGFREPNYAASRTVHLS